MEIIASWLLLVLFVPLASPLYFHIAETERKCFIEEIPDETMVTGNYKVQLYDPRSVFSCINWYLKYFQSNNRKLPLVGGVPVPN
jgi:hypothetical protein